MDALKPALNFPPDSVEVTEMTLMGDAVKAEKPEIGQPSADQQAVCRNGNFSFRRSLRSAKYGNHKVITPLKMEKSEPLETADTAAATTIVSRDETKCGQDDPATTGIMVAPPQRPSHPHLGIGLGADQADETPSATCDPPIFAGYIIRGRDKCNAPKPLCDEGLHETDSTTPSSTQTGKTTYQCPSVCLKSVPSILNIQKVAHTRIKPYQRTECSESSMLSGDLNRHMQTDDTSEKPYQCDVCYRSFSESGNLKKHMVTHTGEKPYKCLVCDKGFSQSSSVKVHLRTHTGEKPYECTECSKAFPQAYDLKVHVRTHSGEKPYLCSLCGRSFPTTGSLKYHMVNTKDHPTVQSVPKGSLSLVNVIDPSLPTETKYYTISV